MKKFLTFNNFILVVAIAMLILQVAPFIGFYNDVLNTTSYYNFFKVTFGGQISISNPYGTDMVFTLVPCASLILAFVFEIVAILSTVAKNKFKLGSFLAAPFYITAGILLCLSVTFVKYANINSMGQASATTLFPTGVKYAVSIMFIIIGCFSVIDAIATFAKPKAQQVY